jgi:hypothetical protein
MKAINCEGGDDKFPDNFENINTIVENDLEMTFSI